VEALHELCQRNRTCGALTVRDARAIIYETGVCFSPITDLNRDAGTRQPLRTNALRPANLPRTTANFCRQRPKSRLRKVGRQTSMGLSRSGAAQRDRAALILASSYSVAEFYSVNLLLGGRTPHLILRTEAQDPCGRRHD